MIEVSICIRQTPHHAGHAPRRFEIRVSESKRPPKYLTQSREALTYERSHGATELPETSGTTIAITVSVTLGCLCSLAPRTFWRAPLLVSLYFSAQMPRSRLFRALGVLSGSKFRFDGATASSTSRAVGVVVKPPIGRQSRFSTCKSIHDSFAS